LLDSLLQEIQTYHLKMANPDLVKFLNPNFHSCPPTDVRFWFKEQDGIIKEVKAHRLILACASDVFNKGFFGSFEAESDVEIKDASQSVFLTMIEFIYNKKLNYKECSLNFLISLYYLADKYNIEQLRKEILDFIPEHEVTSETALDVAILAENNILHKSLSDALYDASASFVKNADGEGMLERVMDLFAKENEEHSLVIFKIMEKAKKTEINSCKNCKKSPCIDGEKLTEKNFTQGASVALSQNGAIRILIKVVQEGLFIANGWGDLVFKFSTGYNYKCCNVA